MGLIFPKLSANLSNSSINTGSSSLTTLLTSSWLSFISALLLSIPDSKVSEATRLYCLTPWDKPEVVSVEARDQQPCHECDIARLNIVLGRTHVDWCKND